MTQKEYLQMLAHFMCLRGKDDAKRERLKFLCIKFCNEVAKSIKPVCKTINIYYGDIPGPVEVSLYCMVNSKRGLMLQPCKLKGQLKVVYREIKSLYDHHSEDNQSYNLTDLDSCKEFFSKLSEKIRHSDIVM